MVREEKTSPKRTGEVEGAEQSMRKGRGNVRKEQARLNRVRKDEKEEQSVRKRVEDRKGEAHRSKAYRR